MLDSASLASNLNGGWKGIWAATHRQMSGANPDDDFDFDIMNYAEERRGSESTSEEPSGR